MPKGVVAIYFIQLFSTCSFAVLFASLVLYMRQKLGLPGTVANTLTGVYFAYNFALHLLSGFIGGRLFSYRGLITIGIIFQLIGCLFLSHPTMNALYYGLTGMLMGTGTIVTCINMSLSQLFKSDDPRREAIFFWNYSGMNIGFVLGFSLVGYFQMSVNYSELFIASALINIVAGFCLAINWRTMKDKHTIYAERSLSEKRRSRLLGLLVIAIMLPSLHYLLQHARLSDNIVLTFAVFMYGWILYQAFRHQGRKRNNLLAFFLLLCAALMFFIIYQLAPMGMTLFAQYNVNRHVMGIDIMPGWIQNINSVTIIIGGPLLAMFFKRLRKKGRRITVAHQYAAGLIFCTIGLFFIPWGIKDASHAGYVAFSWLFFYCIFQAIAELCISPVGYSMVGLLVPKRLQSVTMGTVLLNTGVAAVLASKFSNLALGTSKSHNPLITNQSFSHVFTTLGWTTLGFAIVMLLLIPLFKRWIRPLAVSQAD